MYYKTYINLERKHSIQQANDFFIFKNTECSPIININQSSIYKRLHGKFNRKIKWFKYTPEDIKSYQQEWN